MRKNNQDGFSLLEVLLASALMGVVAMGMMSLAKNQQKDKLTAEINAEINDITTIIKQAFNDQEACNATLTGVKPGTYFTDLRLVRDLSIEPVAQVGKPFKNFKSRISKMRLLSRTEEIGRGLRGQDSINGLLNSNGEGFAYLEISFEKGSAQNKDFYGGKEISKTFPIKAEFADFYIVNGCTENDLDLKCVEAFNSVKNNSAIDCADYTMSTTQSMRRGQATEVLSETCPGPKSLVAECKIFNPCLPVTSCSAKD